MQTKMLEVRDRSTFIPVVAVLMDPTGGSGMEDYLMRRAGYHRPMVLLTRAVGGQAYYDPHDWANRTMETAHQYIAENWAKLASGEVVDVEYILGEAEAPKASEASTCQ